MSVLFKDVKDESTIEVDCIKNKIHIFLIQDDGIYEPLDACIVLDVPTAIALRKAISLNIGKARSGGSNE